MPSTSAKFRDWAALSRLPNLPTVWSNVIAGWALVDHGWQLDWSWPGVPLAVLASATLVYSGACLVNDAWDAEADARNRPDRPIPSGRVSQGLAATVGACFLLSGTLITPKLAPLLLPVLGYGLLHQQFARFSAIVMGLCRAVLVICVSWLAWRTNHFDDRHLPTLLFLFYVVALWGYVSAISWVAKDEDIQPSRKKAVGAMLAGLPLLDGVFLLGAGAWVAALASMVCFACARGLQKVAAAT